MVYHVTCSTDNNYLQHCEVMLCSLFENNKNYQFKVHLLHSELTKQSMDILTAFCSKYDNLITFYHIDDKMLRNVNRRENSPVSIATYYRVLLPSLLDENIERVFYLDCDVIILGNIIPLFEINLDGYGVAAVHDASPYDSLHRELMGLDLTGKAFCAGVMMINLNFWREHNCKDALLEYSNKKQDKVYLEDQDALNFVFRNHWFQLPYKWAKTPLSIGIPDPNMRYFDQFEYAYEPRLIHYAGPLKPWCDVWFPERKYYLKYLNISRFANAKMKPVTIPFKANTYKNICRYWINRYIRPLIPNIIEIFIVDIINLLVIIFTIIFKPINFSKKLLFLWLKKYK